MRAVEGPVLVTCALKNSPVSHLVPFTSSSGVLVRLANPGVGTNFVPLSHWHLVSPILTGSGAHWISLPCCCEEGRYGRTALLKYRFGPLSAVMQVTSCDALPELVGQGAVTTSGAKTTLCWKYSFNGSWTLNGKRSHEDRVDRRNISSTNNVRGRNGRSL